MNKEQIIENLVALRVELQSIYDSLDSCVTPFLCGRNELNSSTRSVYYQMCQTFPVSYGGAGLYWKNTSSRFDESACFSLIISLKKQGNEKAEFLYRMHKDILDNKGMTIQELSQVIDYTDELRLKEALEYPALKKEAKAVKKCFDKFMEDYQGKFVSFGKELLSLNERNEAVDVLEKNKDIEVEKIKQQYSELVKKNQKFLHESDFENVDYILYLFVTGRTTKMEKALQLLDEERRNQRLVDAVETSAQYVVSNFANIINNLGNRIESAINKIGNQITGAISAASDAIVSAQKDSTMQITKGINAMAKSNDAMLNHFYYKGMDVNIRDVKAR